MSVLLHNTLLFVANSFLRDNVQEHSHNQLVYQGQQQVAHNHQLFQYPLYPILECRKYLR